MLNMFEMHKMLKSFREVLGCSIVEPTLRPFLVLMFVTLLLFPVAAADFPKMLKMFPEVLGCSVADRLAPNVQRLEVRGGHVCSFVLAFLRLFSQGDEVRCNTPLGNVQRLEVSVPKHPRVQYCTWLRMCK